MYNYVICPGLARAVQDLRGQSWLPEEDYNRHPGNAGAQGTESKQHRVTCPEGGVAPNWLLKAQDGNVLVVQDLVMVSLCIMDTVS